MEKKKENTCMLCGTLFCCSNCRKKHVAEKHPEAEPSCPLCNSEQILRFAGAESLISHIAQHHLPLACIKCQKYIQSEADMRKLDHTCILAKVSAQPEVVVSSASGTPEPERSLAQAKTPRLNLMAHIADGDYAQNLARCAASAYMNGCSTQVTTQLFRSTSTPTVQELTCVLKTTNQFLNGSQMSSIYNQSSVLGISPLGYTPMAPRMDKFKIPIQKMRPKGTNVTPLRQVMSQNVQRALMNRDFMTNACPSPGSIPLDLCTRKEPEPTEPDCDAVEEIIEDSGVDVLKTPIKGYQVSAKESPEDCEFFTPHNGRFRRRRSSIFVQVDEYECDDMSSDRHIEVVSSAASSFESYDHGGVQEPKVSLWNVLSTVFRFASNKIMAKPESEQNDRMLAERDPDDTDSTDSSRNSSLKRRLNSPTQPTQQNSPQSPRNPPPKRLRGRPPITRMRKLKEQSDSQNGSM